MHHILSTVVSNICSPVSWIILLTLIAVFSKRATLSKWCKWGAIGVFLLFSNSWLINSYARYWQPSKIQLQAGEHYSCGILLGGFGSPDINDSGYFNSTADRYIQTLKLYKTGKINHILINGGNGKLNRKGFNEGAWVKSELISMGVPDSAIISEDRSSNTEENAFYTRKLLDSLKINPPYLLITSAHHMPRASLIFRNEGVETKAYPCNYICGHDRFSLSALIPSFYNLFTWETYLKETAGYFIYSFRKKKHT